MEEAKRLYRSRDGYIGGVCAGIADRLNLDSIVVRIFAILLALSTFGLGAAAYVVMWIALPIATSNHMPYDVEPEYVESKTYGNVDCSQARGRTADECSSVSQEEGMNTPVRVVVAISLIMLFLIVTAGICPMLKGTYWWQYWPIGIMIAGIALIVVPIARKNTSYWHLAGVVMAFIGGSLLPISLGYLSTLTIGRALYAMWPIIAFALTAFLIAVKRDIPSLAVFGVALFGLFCIVGVMFLGVPGSVEHIMFVTPSGHSIYLPR